MWVVLCIVVCLCVAIGVLACVPAWDGVDADTALEAVLDLLRGAGS